MEDGYKLWALSKSPSFYIKPFYLIEHEMKMAQIKADYDYNMSPNCVCPTWASTELGFLMKYPQYINKKRSLFSWLFR